MRYDLNRLEYKIQLSDRRRFEGLFIKTFSPLVSGAQHHTVCRFLLFCMRRDVRLSWARFGGIFFGRVGIFRLCLFRLIVGLWGAEKQEVKQQLCKMPQEIHRNWLIYSRTCCWCCELFFLFYSGNHRELWFEEQTSRQYSPRNNGFDEKLIIEQLQTGLFKDRRRDSGIVFDGFSGESLLVSFHNSQCCSTQATLVCCCAWLYENIGGNFRN